MDPQKRYFLIEKARLERSFPNNSSLCSKILNKRIKDGQYPEIFKSFLLGKKQPKKSKLSGSQNLKNHIISKFEFRCQNCKREGVGAEVRHILPFKTHPHLDLEPSNLTLLCRPCYGLTIKKKK